MQFPNTAGVEPHVDPGDALGDTQFTLGDLAGPATALLPDVSVSEREPQIGQRAVISRGRIENVGVFRLPHRVPGTWIASANAWPSVWLGFGRGYHLSAQKAAGAEREAGQQVTPLR